MKYKVRSCCLYKYPEWIQEILSAAGAVEGVAGSAPLTNTSNITNNRRESSTVVVSNSTGCGSCGSSYVLNPSAPTNRSNMSNAR